MWICVCHKLELTIVNGLMSSYFCNLRDGWGCLGYFLNAFQILLQTIVTYLFIYFFTFTNALYYNCYLNISSDVRNTTTTFTSQTSVRFTTPIDTGSSPFFTNESTVTQIAPGINRQCALLCVTYVYICAWIYCIYVCVCVSVVW